MLSQEAQLIALVSNEKLPEKADAIVFLEGDEDFIRADKALELYEKKIAPIILVLGPQKIADHLIGKGLNKKAILRIEFPEEKSKRNTHTEASNVIKLAIEKNWKNIVLITSLFHQPRAYLTFLKIAKEYGVFNKIRIFNAPVSHPWFANLLDKPTNRWGRLLGWEGEKGEFEKIKEYQVKGDLASLDQALEYQKWKEQQ